MTTQLQQRQIINLRSIGLRLFALLLLAFLPGSAAAQWTTNGNNINNTNSGNVGVGTTAPNAKLHVAGGIYSSQVIESANTSGFRLVVTGPGDTRATWSYDGGATTTRLTSASNVRTSFGSNGINDRMFLDLSGNLGINTTAPGGKLHIEGAMAAPAVSGTGMNSTIRVGALPSTNLVLDMGVDANSSVYTWLQSRNATNYALNYSLALNPNGGNVGIGTNNPTTKLHVVGDGNITGTLTAGTFTAKYQDIAEWVPSSQELAAGTVVVLDSTKANNVVASHQAYDTHVAGVITAQPGLTLGESGDGRVLVATTGRVKVKVSAANGPIQIGDLLVTSDVQGIAVKSIPVEIGGIRLHRPGTLIGKALESLASGTGEILVLLSLQ
ncbi:MAG TPA: hypothetical protein VFM63_08225 [Pyrinomonadaceae bacterium]|nr:hypothetical protein [Pyrinomonadaceae bacterium]